MLLKLAQATFKPTNVVTPEVALRNETTTERFQNLISGVKRVAKKSDEFVYFVCRAIHAMEVSNVDPKTGEIVGDGHIAIDDGNGKCKICQQDLIKNTKGETVTGIWHSASGIDPYINQNGDAFPEAELLTELENGKKAFETFVGRGLFVNHRSDDAEAIRGIILDAMWDEKTKGVDILVACDKVMYPELARQIEAGYSNDVSMGTRVAYSLCSVCGNKAVTENDYCFIPGTQILMEDGTTKRIEDVEIGDLVVTHTGDIQKVTHVFEREIDEEICEIKVTGLQESLLVTKNHPFYVSLKENTRCSYDDRQFCKPFQLKECDRHPSNHQLPSFNAVFVEAGELKKGDYTITPVIKIKEGYKDFTIDEVKFLGYFAAEGSFIKNYNKIDQYSKFLKGIAFALNLEEEKDTLGNEIIQLCKRIFNKEPRCYEWTEKNVYEIRLHDKKAALFCFEHVGEYANNKQLSIALMNATTELQKHFIGAYFDGDGYQFNEKECVVTTASKQLENQLRYMLLRNGIITHQWKTQNTPGPDYIGEKEGNDIHRITLFKRDYYKLAEYSNKIQQYDSNKNYGSCVLYNDNLYRPIQFIKYRSYKGYVYNLEVEGNNSYIANNIAVHNCEHVRHSKGLRLANNQRVYEINNGLEFIEISVVANGADPQAKIRHILASLRTEMQNRTDDITHLKQSGSLKDDEQLLRLEAEVNKLQVKVASIAKSLTKNSNIEERKQNRINILNKMGTLASITGGEGVPSDKTNISNEGEIVMGNKKEQKKEAYMQGTEEPTTYPVDPLNDQLKKNEDKQMVGQGTEMGDDGLASNDLAIKQKLYRAKLEDRRKNRETLLQKISYFQGTEEPTTYPVDGMNDQLKKNEDKQMVGKGTEMGDDGLAGDDLAIKQKLFRAKLRAKFIKAEKREDSYWTVYAGTEPVLQATAKDLYGGVLDETNLDNKDITNWQWVSSRDYGINLINGIKQAGFDKVKKLMFGEQEVKKEAQVGDLAGDALPAPGDSGQGLDLPMPEEGIEEVQEEQVELGSKEQIREALDKISAAIEEIRAVNEGEEATLDTLENEENLMDSEQELKDLDMQLGASTNKERIKKIEAIIKDAIADANLIIKQATSFSKKTVTAAEDKKKDKKEDEEDTTLEIEVEDAKADDVTLEEEKEVKASLKTRSEKRHAVAQALYNVNPYDAVKDAHPAGGTDTKAGEKPVEGDAHVETIAEQQAADIAIVNKSPRGEMTASQKSRRELVAQFEKVAKEMEDEEDEEKVEIEVNEEGDMEVEAGKKKGPGQPDGTGPYSGTDKCQMSDKKKDKKAEDTPKKEVKAEDEKAYYAEMYGDQQFASELTQDYSKQKQTASEHDTILKVKRAYQVALKQQQLGQIASTQEALEAQVDRLVKMDSMGFASFAAAVENTVKTNKTASADEVREVKASLRPGIQNQEQSFTDQLNQIGWS